jgi:hypothetical protein
VLVVVLACVGALLALAATGAPLQRVTLTVERYFDPACTPIPGQPWRGRRGGCDKLRFSGTISSDAANEYVSVLHQRCGSTGLGTSLAGAQTKAGGGWETEWWPTAGVFRARWGGSVTGPVRFRDSVPLQLMELGPSRQRVTVSGDQDMKGRLVVLQRLAAGQWRTLRRARFVRDRSSYGVNASVVTFTVRQRGLVLRAFVPDRSARPCYVATASETWTSGVRTGALGSRVIDRTLLCSTRMQGGIQMVTVHASPMRQRPVQDEASFYVSSGYVGGLVGASTNSLTIYPDACKETAARVPLEAGKLPSRPPGPDGRTFKCEVPLRVLVRVRAVFREATSLERNPPPAPGYDARLAARGEVSLASLAVRTTGGRPLAFATVSGSGRARLFVSRGCFEDT